MSEITRTGEEFNDYIRTLRDLETQQIQAWIVAAFNQTADGFQRIAAGITILEERGVDLSHMRIYGITYLRKIACGQMLPELMAKFSYSKLLQRASNMPLNQQHELLRTETVKVFELTETGPTFRQIPLNNLTPEEVQQVFDVDHIRDEVEQVAWLRTQLRRYQRAPKSEERVRWTGNRKGVDLVGRFTKKELQAILAGFK